MIELVDWKIGDHRSLIAGAHQGGIGRNARFTQHADHQDGQVLAIAVAVVIDRGKVVGLPAADVQGDRDIAGILLQHAVEPLDLLPRILHTGDRLLHPHFGCFRQFAAVAEQRAVPGGEIVPGIGAPGIIAQPESARRKAQLPGIPVLRGSILVLR